MQNVFDVLFTSLFNFYASWLEYTVFTLLFTLTNVAHFGMSLIRLAPIYVHVDLTPPIISTTVGSTGPLLLSSTLFPSAPL